MNQRQPPRPLVVAIHAPSRPQRNQPGMPSHLIGTERSAWQGAAKSIMVQWLVALWSEATWYYGVTWLRGRLKNGARCARDA